MVFNLTKNKKESIKLINIPINELSYYLTHKISDNFNTTITEIMDEYNDGSMMITDNEKVFAEFLLEEWSSSKGFSSSNKSSVNAMLWLDFVFINDKQNVMRIMDNDKIYYIYYNKEGQQRHE